MDLRELVVLGLAICTVHGLFSNTRSRVRVNSQLSKEFEVRVGDHQGSVISPLSFIIFLEALSRNLNS